MQIQVRKHNLVMTDALLEHIERRLNFSLGRFGVRLRTVVVNLHDLNGPKGGVDQECKLTMRTSWKSEIVIEERDADVFAAVARAADRAGRAVERQASLRYGSGPPGPARTQF